MAWITERETSKGKAWKATYRDAEGKQRSKTFGTRAKAKTWLAGKTTDLHRGEWTNPDKGRITFREYQAGWAAGRVHLRDSTTDRDCSYFKSLVLPTFGSMALSAVQPVTVRAWVADLISQDYAPATIRKAAELAGAVFLQAVEDGRVKLSPFRGVKLPRVEKVERNYLSPAQVAELAEAAGHYRALILTAAYTGCRFGELAGLKVGKVDLLRRTITIDSQLSEVGGKLVQAPPKTAASRRTISIPASLVAVLEEQLQHASGGYLFTSPEGGPLRRGNFRKRVWLPLVGRVFGAGFDLRFHDLRHTAAAILIGLGENVLEVQRRLGHSNVTTTLNVYGHLFDFSDTRTAARLDEAWQQAGAAFVLPENVVAIR